MTVRIKRPKQGKLRRANISFRTLIIFFLMFCVSPLACTPSVPAPNITATVPANALVFIAEADTYARQSMPNTNYGNNPKLRVDGASDSGYESFIRFSVEGIPSTVEHAILRLYIPTNGGEDGPAIYATYTSWDETEVTWSQRPAHMSEAVDNKDRLDAGTWAEYNVTPIVTGNGTFSFVLVEDSDSSVVFSSREGDQPPQLVVTFGVGTAAESGDSAILVGAGDIAKCDSDNDELTAQLLDAIPGTVFTTGDNVYESGTSVQYESCYEPTWGRHKARTKPIPGDHDYETSDAAGYFQYFDNIPAYYAYDLGAWRIYALNSEIGVSSESPQAVWLQEDLTANPRQCVLAYWHQPRWSSGTHHGDDRKFQPLWRILYRAGAEVLISGHEHNYERFAPMNAAGEPHPKGMRQFVVGTGGTDLYEFGPALPTSEVRNDTSHGVLKLTLRENSYEWEFIPVAGSTFTDSGSTECH